MNYAEYENLRDKANMTNSQVAKHAGIPRSTFTDWKNGRSKPKEEKMGKILAALYEYGSHQEHKRSKADALFSIPSNIDDFYDTNPYSGYERAQNNMRILAELEKTISIKRNEIFITTEKVPFYSIQKIELTNLSISSICTSTEVQKIMDAYMRADRLTKQMVIKILDIKDEV